MAQIEFHNLTFAYEGSSGNIFENLNLRLDSRWRLGVVGRNGAGKLLVCHCSSGQNNVVVTEFAASGFTVVGRPGIYST